MNIFVCGSLAYDRIMDFPGKFSDHIMPDKTHMLNVSFTVTSMVERPGGTAGNIAYAIALLGEKPTILATIGNDCQRYFEWLARHGISTEGILIVEDEFTASADITTDQADNQITAFNPGAMKRPSRYDLSKADPTDSICIIAAGNLEDMVSYRDTCLARGIPFIFDPAQSLPIWDGKALARCIEGARVLISNDYELALIQKQTGLNKGQLLERARAVITTRGEHGSVVSTRDGEVTVPALQAARLVDPTGAGDAYRGGLIKGLIEGKDLVTCARMGTVCASYAVEVQGTQTYTFTMDQFNVRCRDAFR